MILARRSCCDSNGSSGCTTHFACNGTKVQHYSWGLTCWKVYPFATSWVVIRIHPGAFWYSLLLLNNCHPTLIACSLWAKCWNLQNIPGRVWYWAALGSLMWGALIKLTTRIEDNESFFHLVQIWLAYIHTPPRNLHTKFPGEVYVFW